MKQCGSEHGDAVKRSTRDDVTTVRVGDIVAQCPECGETRFRRRARGGDSADTVYVCVSCNAKVARLDLVNQIGDEASRRARVALDSMRKRKPRRRR
jgi:DNA-directed RNA polymerase subunit RPC12/RpoP